MHSFPGLGSSVAGPRGDDAPADQESVPECVPAELDLLEARAMRLLANGRRAILGIAGPPGAGKSTLARALQERMGRLAATVEMDGFHLSQAELERTGKSNRKGAPDTFDSYGYAALLHRLRGQTESVVYAPAFRRDLDEAIAGAVAIPADVPLLITEGNYLLLDRDGWSHAHLAMDETWYIDLANDLRVARLVERHRQFGKPETVARAWVNEVDQANAALVRDTRSRADLVIR